MRYRHLLVSSTGGIGRGSRDEGLPVYGDPVDGVKQFPHGGDEGHLGELAATAEMEVIGSQPGVLAHRGEGGHPQGASQGGVSDGCDAGAG